MMSIEQADGSRGMAKGDLSYKYQRLRERLRSAVKTGELTGKLPGERELARRYAANAKTINKALNDLAMEGLILRHVGRGTFVAGTGPVRPIPEMASRTFAWLAPGVDHHDAKVLVSIATELLQNRGHRLECLNCEFDSWGELPDSVLSPRALRQIDGVIIVAARPSRELLANLRRRHLPVVLVNNHHRDIRLPTVLADQSYGAYALTEKCIQLGHERIQLIMRPGVLPAATAAQSGYESAMKYYGRTPLPVFKVEASFDWSNVTAAAGRPTALLCVGGNLATEARQMSIDAGLAVPIDMSVAAICGPAESCAERVAITSYDFDPKRILHWVVEFINEGLSPAGPQLAIVPGRLNDRGSIVPPADRPSQTAKPAEDARL